MAAITETPVASEATPVVETPVVEATEEAVKEVPATNGDAVEKPAEEVTNGDAEKATNGDAEKLTEEATNGDAKPVEEATNGDAKPAEETPAANGDAAPAEEEKEAVKRKADDTETATDATQEKIAKLKEVAAEKVAESAPEEPKNEEEARKPEEVTA
jgi:hypothetical protein